MEIGRLGEFNQIHGFLGMDEVIRNVRGRVEGGECAI